MRRRLPSGRVRLVSALAATALVLVPLIWLWQSSRMPSAYSVMDMGYADGGQAGGHHHGVAAGHAHHSMTAAERGIAAVIVVDPKRRADVAVTLVANRQRLHRNGRTVDAFTLNGQTPGPTIRATVGQLVQVRLVNRSVPGGITLHWHGMEVPNSQDGVAGVTQDAVGIGREFTYRFVVGQAGTFWYHSHQLSHEQVRRGLLGAFVVDPPRPAAGVVDTTALVHLYDGTPTVNGRTGELRVAVPPGQRARVRVINTENGPMSAWVAGAGYRLVAVDGRELHRPTLVRAKAVLVTAGGRADLEIPMPADGSAVRVQIGAVSVVLGSGGYAAPTTRRPAATLDLLSYGSPAPLAFDPSRPDRSFTYAIGRRPGFLAGRPGLWWTVNGHLFPDVPMFVVAEGDVVRMTIANHSGEVHPMHLHGHHAVVLTRDGVASTGSPWWVDSLNVGDGETYEIAFLADNPGYWMDHCHNLPHAAEGLVAHLMYEGVKTPYLVGGAARNQPE
ncbi:multicopper oxidase family protein [Flindersiella endophytica]